MKAHKISSLTKVCAVIGDPVAHSLSPQIHNAAFTAAGEDLVYTAFHVRKGDLKRALDGVRSLGIKGLSVTIPHKVDIIPFLDEVDPDALATGSVNTVINSSGVLIGCSTDGPGAVRALEAYQIDPAGKKILMLGSGGAARAIAFALRALEPQPSLEILGIDEKETGTLVEDLNRKNKNRKQRGIREVTGSPLTGPALATSLDKADIVIHATPVGMSPNQDESLVPSTSFRAGQVIFDVVYTPKETRLLKDAREAGAVTVSGLGMFVNQAAIQFELWTGNPAPVETMTRAVEEALYSPDGG